MARPVPGHFREWNPRNHNCKRKYFQENNNTIILPLKPNIFRWQGASCDQFYHNTSEQANPWISAYKNQNLFTLKLHKLYTTETRTRKSL